MDVDAGVERVQHRGLVGQPGEHAQLNLAVVVTDDPGAGRSKEQVTKKQRAVGKTLNFAVVYGSGASNIAEMLSALGDPVTKEDAEGYLRDYFAGFP